MQASESAAKATLEETATSGLKQTCDGVNPGTLGIGALFGLIHEAAVVIDASTLEVVLWNRAAKEIFGYETEEACGMDPIYLLGPEEQAAVRQSRAAGKAGPFLGKADTGEVASVAATHKYGFPLRVEATFSTLKPPYIISIIRDVTRKKRLEAYAVAVVEELAKRDDAELPKFQLPAAPAGIQSDYKTPKIPLTRRELEILCHVARGASNRKIAEALFIGESTVKSHMTSIISKLEVDNRSEAAVKALKLGLLT